MKKKITIAILFVLLAVTVNGQTDNRDKFQIGVKAGGSLSNVYDTKGQDFNARAKLGFTGGVFFTIPINTLLGVQPEVLITQKGFRGYGRMLGQDYNFKRTTTFLEVPLLLAIKPAEFITVVIGPQYSFLLHQRDVFKSSFISYAQEQQLKQDNIRRNMLGFVTGLDINIGNIVIGGRFGVDLLRNRGNGNSNTPRYRNVSGQVTVGYKFL